MSEVINFNRFKAERAKADKKAKAAENRSVFGRNKAQKAREKAAADKLQRELDGAKRED